MASRNLYELARDFLSGHPSELKQRFAVVGLLTIDTQTRFTALLR